MYKRIKTVAQRVPYRLAAVRRAADGGVLKILTVTDEITNDLPVHDGGAQPQGGRVLETLERLMTLWTVAGDNS